MDVFIFPRHFERNVMEWRNLLTISSTKTKRSCLYVILNVSEESHFVKPTGETFRYAQTDDTFTERFLIELLQTSFKS